MEITLSKHSPNAKGDQVAFSIGDRVVYKDNRGTLVEIIIQSEKQIANNYAKSDVGKFCYNAIFTDTGELAGAIAERIVWWPEKQTPKPIVNH